MARVVEGSEVLLNERGAAPGILIRYRGRVLAAFPGVPWEMRDMLRESLVPELEARGTNVVRASRTLLLGGVYESDTEGRVRHLYDVFGRHDVTILASFGVLRLLLQAHGGRDEAARRLDEMEAAFREVLGDDVAGVDVSGLAEVVVGRLIGLGATLATAESCTGGLVGAELTSVSGASEAYAGGVVSYSNDAKEGLIGVPHEVLIEHGAVSEPVARAMAAGVRQRLGSDWGLGVTGIAGPTGGSDDKPVGLVHWAVAGRDGVWADHHVFSGDRDVVRTWSMNSVLDLLRRRLGAASA
jgi:nicotinamide-nucleotide amidase